MPKVNLLWHNFFIFVFPFFYIKHTQWCLISKQDGVDPLFLGLSSKYTWNHSAGNAKIIESWIEKGGWIGASGFEEWQHGEFPGFSFHFTCIPTVGTKRTGSLKPPKSTDIKTSKNNKKACFLWPTDKEKRSQTKYWWGTLNCSTTGAPAGSPTHQWKPWAVPVPTAKLGPSAVSSACNSWSSKATDLHISLLLSCCLRGPSDLPTAASAKSQDLPDPIPQQSTKAASPCLSTSGTTRPRGLSSTPRRSHSENRHTGDIPSAPAGGTREDWAGVLLRQSKAGVLHQKNKLDQNNMAKAQKTKVSL